MHLFIRKAFSFIFVVIVIIVSSFFILTSYFQFKPFSIDNGRRTVFLGDSRVQYLYNSEDNLALYSEGLKFSYCKLLALDKIADLDTVFLGFSHHILSDYYDQYLDSSISIAPPPGTTKQDFNEEAISPIPS